MKARRLTAVLRAVMVVASLACGAAEAQYGPMPSPPPGPPSPMPGRRGVPEFDPATIGVVAALVAGGGVLLARRRRR
jgi:hypothetical protein